MKKVIIVSIVVVSIVGLLLISFLTWNYINERKEKQDKANSTLSDAQIDLIENAGNGVISITDPYLKKQIDINFKDKVWEATIDGKKVKYEIFDALQPYNMDNGSENEYPFMIKATYPNKTTTYLLISHVDGQKLTALDMVEVGDPAKIEDIHSSNKEVLIDANVVTDQGKTEQVILSYTFANNKVIPNPKNIDISKVLVIQKPVPVVVPPKTDTSSGTSGKVALTFDDGPGAYTPQILAVLKQYNVPATFFQIGQNAEAHPDFVKQVLAEDHVISDHTYTHPDLSKLSSEAQMDEIKKTRLAIESIIAGPIHYFRPPYGAYNDETDGVVSTLAMEKILWNVDPKDWSGIPAESISQNVLANTKSGSIVLMHDGVANSVETAKALPSIIEGLRGRGFKLVTLPQL